MHVDLGALVGFGEQSMRARLPVLVLDGHDLVPIHGVDGARDEREVVRGADLHESLRWKELTEVTFLYCLCQLLC